MKYFSLIAMILMSACATTKPDALPEFKGETLAAVQLKDFKPRTVTVTVTNTRSSNLKTGNATQVEQAVNAVVEDAFKRGGFTINKKSANKFSVELIDCPDAPDGAACVKGKAKMGTNRWYITLEAFSSNGFSRGNSAYQSFGDMTYAYEQTLLLLMKGLEEKYSEMSQRSNE